jgi:dGTP triphosphohydrolase
LPNKTVQSLLKNYLPRTAFNDILKKSKNDKYLNGVIRDEVKKIHFGSSGVKYNSALVRTIVDFIAGMTDNYAISQYKMLYGSSNYWTNQ